MPPKEQTTITATTRSPEELGKDRPAPIALMPLQAEIAQHEIRGHSLWEARKRVSLSRGDVGRLIGLHDKTVGEIERKNLPVPDRAMRRTALFLELTQPGLSSREWHPISPGPKVVLPFPRPDCPNCKIRLTTRSAKHSSPQRGQYFYFQCGNCKARFWSSDGTPHAANEGRGNWKNVAGPKCRDCNRLCWVEGRSSRRHGRQFWKCPKCDKVYLSVRGKAVLTDRPKPLKRVSFLKSRDCPRCTGKRLRIRTRPPNAPYWYFMCPDCGAGFRWNTSRKLLF